MENTTFTIKDTVGNWVEIDPVELQPNPIVQDSLSDECLEKINVIYNRLRGIISYKGQWMSLEQFELMFMREEHLNIAIGVWDKISKAYEESLNHFSNDKDTLYEVYQWIILRAMGSISEDDSKDGFVRKITDIYDQVNC